MRFAVLVASALLGLCVAYEAGRLAGGAAANWSFLIAAAVGALMVYAGAFIDRSRRRGAPAPSRRR